MAKFSDPWEWERAAIMELNSDHEYVCRVHKIHLRPVAIVLFDSESKWGEFDFATMTISISRKLVREYPWHDVLGIFRHEMAHQLVAEEMATKKEFRPHGEAFKNACRRLGVPEQYAHAGLDLTTSNLDWRMAPRDAKTEAILNKVRGLLALAESADENEALLAMQRVRELYAKYNLAHNQDEEKKGYIHQVLTHGKKGLPPWLLRIVSILGDHFFVRTLTFRQYDAATGDHVGAIEVIGRRENVLMAEYVFHFLLRQLDELVKRQVESVGLARGDRTSYRLGILDGFAKKMEAARSEKSPAQPEPHLAASRELSVVGQALAQFEHDSEINDYINLMYPRLGRRSEGKTDINSDAFAAGHAAGAAINLHKPMEERSGSRGVLLTSTKLIGASSEK